MTPPNWGGTGGSCFPVIVVVALDEPGVPVTCWAIVEKAPQVNNAALANKRKVNIQVTSPGLTDNVFRCSECGLSGRYIIEPRDARIDFGAQNLTK
ncbi:hypothetical protein [Bradyrhizobium lablabi]|uniref:hypothetical protein n=1 Tax=Bradyrhizobium lablabi TaxID=722472 RepID=UPI003908A9A7